MSPKKPFCPKISNKKLTKIKRISNLPTLIFFWHVSGNTGIFLGLSVYIDFLLSTLSKYNGVERFQYGGWVGCGMGQTLGLPGLLVGSMRIKGSLVRAPVRSHIFVEIYHEIIPTVILPLPLIQEGQLSVSGESMCTKYWLTA